VLLDVLADGWPIFRSLVVDEDRHALWAHLLADAASEGDLALLGALTEGEPCHRALAPLATFVATQLPTFTTFALDVAADSPSRFVSLPIKSPFPARHNRAPVDRLGSLKGDAMPDTDGNHLRVAALRVVQLVCTRYPERWQRAVHSVLRMVWACIDPHTPAPAMRRLCTPAVAHLFRTAVDAVPTFAFSAPAQRVAVATGEEPNVTVYDVKTTSKLAVFAPGTGGAVVTAVAFGAEGATLLTVCRGASDVGLWDLGAGKAFFGLLSGGTTVTLRRRIAIPEGGRFSARARLRLQLITPALLEVSEAGEATSAVRIMLG
jgi:hypothetical protein